MQRRTLALTAVLLSVPLAPMSAEAITFDTLASSGDTAQDLADALATGGNVTVTGGSAIYGLGQAGTNLGQAGTFTDFNFAGGSGQPPISLADGIVITTGTADVPPQDSAPFTNTSDVVTGTGPSTLLENTYGLISDSTSDGARLDFTFTVDPGVTGIELDIVFGTEEFPSFRNDDPFAVILDIADGGGTNLAAPIFSSLSTIPAYNANIVGLGPGPYPITYNGITPVLTLAAAIDPAQTSYTLTIAIADAGDSIVDSGLFISGLRGVTATTPIPLPAPAFLLLGALGMLTWFRKRSAA